MSFPSAPSGGAQDRMDETLVVVSVEDADRGAATTVDLEKLRNVVHEYAVGWRAGRCDG